MKRTLFKKLVGALALTAGWTLAACGGTTISFNGQSADQGSVGRGDCPVGTMRPVADFHYEVTRNGQTFQIPSMRDNLQQGDHVEAVFTIANGCRDVELTLASYTAPSDQDGTELQQALFDSDSGTFGEGNYRLQIDVPNCYFQTDFAYGPVIQSVRDEGTYGARNIDSDVGGTQVCNGSNTAPASSSSTSASTDGSTSSSASSSTSEDHGGGSSSSSDDGSSSSSDDSSSSSSSRD